MRPEKPKKTRRNNWWVWVLGGIIGIGVLNGLINPNGAPIEPMKSVEQEAYLNGGNSGQAQQQAPEVAAQRVMGSTRIQQFTNTGDYMVIWYAGRTAFDELNTLQQALDQFKEKAPKLFDAFPELQKLMLIRQDEYTSEDQFGNQEKSVLPSVKLEVTRARSEKLDYENLQFKCFKFLKALSSYEIQASIRQQFSRANKGCFERTPDNLPPRR